MTGRERILAAIAHREPDRVPVDLGATPSSGISAIAYNALTQHLRLDVGPANVYDVVQQLAQPEEAVLDQFGIDVLDIGRTFNTASSDWYDYTLADGSTGRYPIWFRPSQQADGSWIAHSREGNAIAQMPAGGTFFDQTPLPVRRRISREVRRSRYRYDASPLGRFRAQPLGSHSGRWLLGNLAS